MEWKCKKTKQRRERKTVRATHRCINARGGTALAWMVVVALVTGTVLVSQLGGGDGDREQRGYWWGVWSVWLV